MKTSIKKSNRKSVTFYGCEDSLAKWKKLVKKETGKSCGKIQLDKKEDREYFIANCNQADCEKLGKFWYKKTKDLDGETMPWNWRISFSKSWE